MHVATYRAIQGAKLLRRLARGEVPADVMLKGAHGFTATLSHLYESLPNTPTFGRCAYSFRSAAALLHPGIRQVGLLGLTWTLTVERDE